MKILIIDDDVQLCQSLSFLLERESFDVFLSHDGMDGLNRILENRYDVIILDMMLPILDGRQVLKEMKDREIMTPVIIMTASEEWNDRNIDFLKDVDQCIKKPFAFETLLEMIQKSQSGQKSSGSLLTFGDITLKVGDRLLCSKAKACTLSERESRLFELFLCSPCEPISYNTLINEAWDSKQHVSHKDLELYIGFLRRRLRNIESNLVIKDVQKIGYCMGLSDFS